MNDSVETRLRHMEVLYKKQREAMDKMWHRMYDAERRNFGKKEKRRMAVFVSRASEIFEVFSDRRIRRISRMLGAVNSGRMIVTLNRNEYTLLMSVLKRTRSRVTRNGGLSIRRDASPLRSACHDVLAEASQ